MKPFPGIVEKSLVKRAHKYLLNDEQEVWLARWFPCTENSRVAKAMGISLSSLHRIVRERGLKKSEKGMKAIKRRQAAHVKRLCEKNGYYDSLRGKKPSEKTVQGSKQYWKDVREGRREHPFGIQKREDPKGYRKSTEKRRQSRRELWRKERLRALYMTGRKTHLRVALCPYRNSQKNHRSNALKRGYLLDEDCREGQPGRYVIYYDRDTQRSAAFERNCIKDGFTFKEA
jgi:hypothetical protein